MLFYCCVHVVNDTFACLATQQTTEHCRATEKLPPAGVVWCVQRPVTARCQPNCKQLYRPAGNVIACICSLCLLIITKKLNSSKQCVSSMWTAPHS